MMDSMTTKQIWFVYDGECPLCTQAALALKIKQEYGQLILLNARQDVNHWLMQEIQQRQFDLDEGMVIFDGLNFFHGKRALRFMASYGDNKGWFNLTTKALFWSDSLSSIVYPWLRGIRNCLLKRRKIKKIDNLSLHEQPIFRSIFADSWSQLPLVMHKHYANRPYSSDVTTVEGKLDVMCAGPIKWFSPLFWLLGGIPPHNEKDVAVTVQFESSPDTKEFRFNRQFYFKTRAPYRFQSTMQPIGTNELIEVMKFGVAWKMAYESSDNTVRLEHRGYVMCLFGHLIPMPLTWLMGEGNAKEIAIDDDHFSMSVDITHPWWGKVYQYNGVFKVTATPKGMDL